MGMETRRNSRYYYRKERQGNRVVSSYVGTGVTAELIAQCEYWRRVEEHQERAKLKREQEASKQQAVLVLGTEADVRDLVKAVFIACGFHQHKRQWRRNRMDTQQNIVTAASTSPAPVVDDKALLAEARKALSAAFTLPDMTQGKRGKALEQAKAEAQELRRTAIRKVLQDYPVLWSGARRMFTTAESVMIE
ncbi:MAG: hypothetical protein M3R24_32735, partial [Chloroflexota bacterium]|nr:hypothetical protein [Chloroflexota bacterium]